MEIHPLNPRLFPNIVAFAQNFEIWSIGKLEIESVPLASTLSSGAYSVGVLTPPHDSESFEFVPTWNAMLNVISNKVASIYHSMKYEVPKDITHRMDHWLMNSEDSASYTPGFLVITQSPNSQ